MEHKIKSKLLFYFDISSVYTIFAKITRIIEMKLKINNNYILTICVLALAVICFLSVNKPLSFENEQKKRETIVKEYLLKIRSAENKFRKNKGTYCGDFATLVREGYLADSLQYIPFSESEKFTLQTTVQLGKSGKQIPLMECGAEYHKYLQGMDENIIANLIEKANNGGNYPGLKIGDITTDNNNAGNWE